MHFTAVSPCYEGAGQWVIAPVFSILLVHLSYSAHILSYPSPPYDSISSRASPNPHTVDHIKHSSLHPLTIIFP